MRDENKRRRGNWPTFGTLCRAASISTISAVRFDRKLPAWKSREESEVERSAAEFSDKKKTHTNFTVQTRTSRETVPTWFHPTQLKKKKFHREPRRNSTSKVVFSTQNFRRWKYICTSARLGWKLFCCHFVVFPVRKSYDFTLDSINISSSMQ